MKEIKSYGALPRLCEDCRKIGRAKIGAKYDELLNSLQEKLEEITKKRERESDAHEALRNEPVVKDGRSWEEIMGAHAAHKDAVQAWEKEDADVREEIEKNREARDQELEEFNVYHSKSWVKHGDSDSD